ncbi:MAG: AAA-like domain-containing protein [Nitrospira sp.]|nr:AAA-like domain-containing protein [Nitrospira sp.]
MPQRINNTEAAEPSHLDLRPRPVANLKVLRQPTGTIDVDDPFYVRRPVDDSVELRAATEGSTLVFKGPRQVGKSSLLMRYVAACDLAGKDFVLIDLQAASPFEVETLPGFLRFIAERIFSKVEIASDAIPTLTSPGALGDLLESRVLRPRNKPLVIALDEVDRLIGSPIREVGIAMFRHWHNRRAEPRSCWKRVDLAIALATDPTLLITDPTQSPFNVGEVFRLDSFDQAAVQRLNGLYEAGLSLTQLDQLFQLTGGQPYLTRLAFYRLVGPQKTNFDELWRYAGEEDGPFGEHLRSKLLLLHQSKLADAMAEVIRAPGEVGNDLTTYHRLRAAGFVRRDAGKVVPANLLYARFFKTVL